MNRFFRTIRLALASPGRKKYAEEGASAASPANDKKHKAAAAACVPQRPAAEGSVLTSRDLYREPLVLLPARENVPGFIAHTTHYERVARQKRERMQDRLRSRLQALTKGHAEGLGTRRVFFEAAVHHISAVLHLPVPQLQIATGRPKDRPVMFRDGVLTIAADAGPALKDPAVFASYLRDVVEWGLACTMFGLDAGRSDGRTALNATQRRLLNERILTLYSREAPSVSATVHGGADKLSAIWSAPVMGVEL